MMHIATFFSKLNDIIGSSYILLIVFIAFFSLKLVILTKLTKQLLHTSTYYALSLLITILTSSVLYDVSWIMHPFRSHIDNATWVFILYVAWACNVILYQTLSIFLEHLAEGNKPISLFNKLLTVISSCFCMSFFIISAIALSQSYHSEEARIFGAFLTKITSIYLCFVLMPFIIINTLYKIYNLPIPRILNKQLKLLMGCIITPFWLSDVIQMLSLLIHQIGYWINHNYAFASISNILITYTIFYVARRMMGLRFLNINQHVDLPVSFTFIDTFKTILLQLSKVSSEKELTHITQVFFKESFTIPLNKTTLYIRTPQYSGSSTTPSPLICSDPSDQTVQLTEQFISLLSHENISTIREHKILVYDEIVFSNFYEQTDTRNQLIAFLEAIDADIFLPIFTKTRLTAYIVIEKNARHNSFYSMPEYDQMIVFASYLSNIIDLLHNGNLDRIIAQEKKLQEDLYYKHQEINQYRESINVILQQKNNVRTVGVVFYKNRRFAFANQAAKQIIKINLNTHDGHHLTKALTAICTQVEEYKTTATSFAKDTEGTMIVITAVPGIEQNNVIITLSYPEMSDIIKKHIDLLQNPLERDYLLYLETTQSGKLINQLIPGSGQTLLQVKVNLLKAALSKKALLLSMSDEDLLPTAHLIHHISLRETFHPIILESPCTTMDVAIKLFGINPIFGIPQTEPLLEKLHNCGTIFIKNIHFLTIEAQKQLASYIHYGFYHPLRSEKKEPSNVRIICSSNEHLPTLIQAGKFSAELFNELKETTLIIPSVMTLAHDEFNNLADGFSEQKIKSDTFKNLLSLTDKDKQKLIVHKPTSLHELKKQVVGILERKSHKNQLFEPASEIQGLSGPGSSEQSNDPLARAARLGKKALKDEELMNALWEKFKNQNKIATFLGVNRSSVSRRCKIYQIDQEQL